MLGVVYIGIGVSVDADWGTDCRAAYRIALGMIAIRDLLVPGAISDNCALASRAAKPT